MSEWRIVQAATDSVDTVTRSRSLLHPMSLAGLALAVACAGSTEVAPAPDAGDQPHGGAPADAGPEPDGGSPCTPLPRPRCSGHEQWTQLATPPKSEWLYEQTASAWTGSELILAGFVGPDRRWRDGYAYDPVCNRWTSLPSEGAPTPRNNPLGAWVAERFVVWGGYDSGDALTGLKDGAAYDPELSLWSPVSAPGFDIYSSFTAYGFWQRPANWAVADDRIYLWGGGHDIVTGGIYDVTRNQWLPIPETGAPSARWEHSVVWTGSELIVWGGLGTPEATPNDGGVFNPESRSWRPTSLLNAAARRHGHIGVWTGSRMLIWGGYDLFGRFPVGGALYDPSADTWQPMTNVNEPHSIYQGIRVWTGTELIAMVGPFLYGSSNPLEGGIYRPGSDTWLSIDQDLAPDGFYPQHASWDGCRMLLIGGNNGVQAFWAYEPPP
jgi:hypothetical protein